MTYDEVIRQPGWGKRIQHARAIEPAEIARELRQTVPVSPDADNSQGLSDHVSNQTALDLVLAEHPDLRSDLDEFRELMDAIPELPDTEAHATPPPPQSRLSTEGTYEWRRSGNSWSV